MAEKIRVTLARSPIGRKWDQKRTVRALGLGKIGSSRVLPDNPAVRGMIRKLHHLVVAEVVSGEPATETTRRPSVLVIDREEAQVAPEEDQSEPDPTEAESEEAETATEKETE
jgi:large subunit ribosomal protein L30